MSDQSGAFHSQPDADFDLTSPQRWEGVLTAEQVDHFRSKGLPLAFCPVQIGWVAVAAPPDQHPTRPDDPSAPLSWTVSRPLGAFTVRAWTEADAPAYRGLLNDAKLWEYIPEEWPGEIDEDLARDLIAISNAAPHHEVWAVLRDGTPLGQVRFAFAGHGHKRSEAEISYWFGRDYWGQGLGRRVVKKATAQAFRDHPGLGRIFAQVHPDNFGSSKILELAGYTPCGSRADGWHVFEVRN